jgi:CubicO group peptidase (beta-lactamase class C family)
VLGYLVEILSGQNLETYCQEHIFKPLDMPHTSFVLSSLPSDLIAGSYLRFGRCYVKLPSIDYTFLDPCGGLCSTIDDLSRFCMAHMNGGIYQETRILNQSSIELMHRIQYPESAPYFGLLRFGLGWLIFEDEFGYHTHGHDGDIAVSHARMRIFDENQTAIIYLFNKGFRPYIFPRPIPSLLEYAGDTLIRKTLYDKASTEHLKL